MALIDLFLSRAVKRGTLSLSRPGQPARIFGTNDPAFPDVAIRFADTGVGRAIVADPGLGAAEAFMDGRLLIEQGDIRALVELLTANDPWEAGLSKLAASRHVRRIVERRRAPLRPAQHGACIEAGTSPTITTCRTGCTTCSSTPTANIPAPISPIPPTRWNSAQNDKKAHIAAKLLLEPGMRVLDIGCGWGGMALYLHAKTGAEVLGRHAIRGAAQGRAPPRRGGRESPTRSGSS